MSTQQRFKMGVNRDHVAIMNKSWGLLKKILNGEKTIETRWYQHKYPPYDQIYTGDTVYFKNSGEPVTVKARVGKVIQHRDITPQKVIPLLDKYAKADGLGIDRGSLKKFYHLFKNKKYCIVIYLEDVAKVDAFEIDKQGFGSQAAWLIVPSIDEIKISNIGQSTGQDEA